MAYIAVPSSQNHALTPQRAVLYAIGGRRPLCDRMSHAGITRGSACPGISGADDIVGYHQGTNCESYIPPSFSCDPSPASPSSFDLLLSAGAGHLAFKQENYTKSCDINDKAIMHMTKTFLAFGFAISAAFMARAIPITQDELTVLMSGLPPKQPTSLEARDFHVNVARSPRHKLTLEDLKNLHFDDSGALEESDKHSGGDSDPSSETPERRFSLDDLEHTYFGSFGSAAGGRITSGIANKLERRRSLMIEELRRALLPIHLASSKRLLNDQGGSNDKTFRSFDIKSLHFGSGGTSPGKLPPPTPGLPSEEGDDSSGIFARFSFGNFDPHRLHFGSSAFQTGIGGGPALNQDQNERRGLNRRWSIDDLKSLHFGNGALAWSGFDPLGVGKENSNLDIKTPGLGRFR